MTTRQLTVSASDCFKLMTNPRSKRDELSETTKSWLKEMAIETVLGLRKTVDARPLIKGQMCVLQSIELYNRVMNTRFKRNNTTMQEFGFKGTPSLLGNDCTIKINTSWDASTFPFFKDEANKQVKKAGYDWQCRVYMMLFGMESAVVSYCLVDTPQETPDGAPLLHKWDDYSLHRLEGIVDEKKRISVSDVIERDRAIEQNMRERYEVANRYYLGYLQELNSK